MNEDWDVGACALLAGIHTTAQRFALTHVQVVACLLCLRAESSPLLQSLRKMVYKQMQSFGLQTAAINFGLGEDVVKLICATVETEEKKARPKIFFVTPSVNERLSARPPASRPPPRPVTTFVDKKPEPLLPQYIKRVRLLYDLKVRIRVIAALYGISSELVHSWGDFSRLHNPEKHLLTRSTLQDKLDHGMTLREAAKEMKLTTIAAQMILGQCQEYDESRRVPAPIRVEAIRQATRNPAKLSVIAKRLRVPKEGLKRWVKGDFSFENGENLYIKGDDGIEVGRKRRCLEEFYTTGEEGRAAAATACTIEQVRAIVSDFEARVAGKKDSDTVPPPDQPGPSSVTYKASS